MFVVKEGKEMHLLQQSHSIIFRRVFEMPATTKDLLKPENVAPIHVDGGLVHFTDRLVYLGSIISSDLADDAEYGARIAAAAGAFGCLRARIFGEPLVDLRLKSTACQALILNLLFYGSECWALSSHMLKRLRSFHRRCVRTMCGCSRPGSRLPDQKDDLI